MRAHNTGTGILLGLATVALTAPAALAESTAESPSSTTAAPSTTAPPTAGEVFITADGSPQAGEDIEVVVRCHGKVGAPKSLVLKIGQLREVETPADIPTYVAPATIKPRTPPGDYPLTAPCDGDTLRTTFTVYPSGSDGAKDEDTGAGDGRQVSVMPRGAPETGGEPEADRAALLLGATGLAGLAGLGAVAARRLLGR